MKERRAIVRIKEMTGKRRIFNSIWDAEASGFKSTGVYRCIRGETKLYKGYKWEFLE